MLHCILSKQWVTSVFLVVFLIERQKMAVKDEHHKLEGAQYATGEEWRSNSRKNEKTEAKRKKRPVVYVSGDGSKSDAVKSNIA